MTKCGKHKKPEAVITLDLCEYGCGQLARWKTAGGHLICSPSTNQCPAIIEKNSSGSKRSHSKRDDYSYLKNKVPWNKGLTKEANLSLKTQSEIRTGVRRIADPEKLQKAIYREQCQFDLTGVIEKVKGYDLLQRFGMYSRKTNPSGVVRDHRISVDYGWCNSIDPAIIRHPANCEFLLHSENARKTSKSSIDLDKLMTEINNFSSRSIPIW